MKTKILFSFLIICTLLLCSCDNNATATEGAGGDINTDFALDASEMFTDRDKDASYDESKCITIQLNGTSAACSSKNVAISGSEITIKADGYYLISGKLDDGRITVDAPEDSKPHIILSGADISSSSSAAVFIKECDKLIITLADGTANSIKASGSSAEEDGSTVDGAVFSKQDLSFNGSGSLEVSSDAGHGIVCKDDVVFAGGKYSISAASHGVDANDSIRITASELNIASAKDALHSENSDDDTLGYLYLDSGSISSVCGGDGVSSGAYIQINGGEYSIQTSASSSEDSKKGIKSVGTLLINNGSFTIDTDDDALHSNTSILIKNGDFTIASGDDGMHADESLHIAGGLINITESYEGLEALNVNISGGDITIKASDDGINAAGGNDESGYGGNFGGGDAFGGGRPGMPGGAGGHGGAPGSSSSNGSITISGGKIYMNAYGDGIDANGSLTISGGEITVCGPTSGDTSVLDYDNQATITGGTFIGTGAQMMAQTFSDSSQGVIAITAGSRSAGTEIMLKDSDGNVVLRYTPALPYQLVVISTPDMKKGESYTIIIGDDSGTFEAN